MSQEELAERWRKLSDMFKQKQREQLAELIEVCAKFAENWEPENGNWHGWNADEVGEAIARALRARLKDAG